MRCYPSFPLATVLVLASASAAAAPVQPRCSGAAAHPAQLALNMGKSTMMRLPDAVVHRSVGNPDVVQAMLVAPDTLYIAGIDVGTTNMILQGKNGACSVIDVTVAMDPAALRATLAAVLPDEKNIVVTTAADTVVLSGSVQDAGVAARAGELAAAYPNFSYRPGFIVDEVASLVDGARVRGVQHGNATTLTASKVFLAAGRPQRETFGQQQRAELPVSLAQRALRSRHQRRHFLGIAATQLQGAIRIKLRRRARQGAGQENISHQTGTEQMAQHRHAIPAAQRQVADKFRQRDAGGAEGRTETGRLGIERQRERQLAQAEAGLARRADHHLESAAE